MHKLIDPTVSNSIIYGSIVGLMCLGLTLTYLTTKVPNFAVADFVVVGIYASAAAFILWNMSNPYLTTPLAVIFGGAVAVLMYLIILRPLIRRGSSLVVLMIATLAVDIIFTGILQLFVEYMGSKYGAILNDRGYGGQFYTLSKLPDFQILGNASLLFIAPAVLVVVSLGLFFLLTRSKFGIAMRAAIENANLAKTVGINVERVYFVSWFLAGGIAGLSGALFAIWTYTPEGSSTLIIVDIFAGSILGGLGSIYGAIIGGLIIGAGETFLASFFDQVFSHFFGSSIGSYALDFQKGIPLGIMIIVLLLVPEGLTSINWRKVLNRIGIRR